MCQRKLSSWIESLQELTEGYSLENIWSMDESGCFFKALPDAGLVQKGKQQKAVRNQSSAIQLLFLLVLLAKR